MKRNNNDAQTTIRLSKALKTDIENSAINLNLSTMEWIRRACEEKLEREKEAYRFKDEEEIYVSKRDIRTIKYALQLPEIQEIILSITEKQK